jgi:hypothetical protein
MRRAWEQLLDRHPMLRTRFEGGRAELDPRLALRYEERDLSGWPQPRQEAELAAMREQDRQEGLAAPPSMKVTLLRLAPERHELLWSYDHVLLDGWSRLVLWKELAAFYSAPRPALPDPAPFGQYAALRADDRPTPEEASAWRSDLRQVPMGGWRWAQTARAAQSSPSGLAEWLRVNGIPFGALAHGLWCLVQGQQTASAEVAYLFRYVDRPPQLAGILHTAGVFTALSLMRLRLDPTETVAGFLGRVHRELGERAARSRGLPWSRWTWPPPNPARLLGLPLLDVADFSDPLFVPADWGGLAQREYSVFSTRPGQPPQELRRHPRELSVELPDGLLCRAVQAVGGRLARVLTGERGVQQSTMDGVGVRVGGPAPTVGPVHQELERLLGRLLDSEPERLRLGELA